MCDGTGILEERFIDVDYSIVTECPGCEACDEELMEAFVLAMAEMDLAELLDAMPLWAGMEVSSRKPASSEHEFLNRTRALTAQGE